MVKSCIWKDHMDSRQTFGESFMFVCAAKNSDDSAMKTRTDQDYTRRKSGFFEQNFLKESGIQTGTDQEFEKEAVQWEDFFLSDSFFFAACFQTKRFLDSKGSQLSGKGHAIVNRKVVGSNPTEPVRGMAV